MAQINIINLGKSAHKRLDAEYYRTYYFNILKAFSKISDKKLSDLAFVNERHFDNKKCESFNYLEISDVNLGLGDYTTTSIPCKDAPSRAQYIVKEGDIVVSTVRPNRNAVAYIKESKNLQVCSSGFCVINAKNALTEFLFIFFKTKFIRDLLERSTTATMYPAVSETDIMNLPCFIPDEKLNNKIKSNVKKIMNMLIESQTLFKNADNLILKEVSFDKINLNYQLTFNKKLSDIVNLGRIDAEYFQPKYENLIEKVGISIKILDKAELIDENIEPEKTPEKEFVYIELSDVNSEFGVVDSYSIIKGKDAPSRAKIKVHTGDIIVSSVEGSLGKTAIITEEFNNSIVSNGFFVFRPKNITPEYLLILMKNKVIQLQLQRNVKGTILTSISKKVIEELFIPKLSGELEKKISEQVAKSIQLRSQAKLLFSASRNQIEEIIQKEMN
ncbi:hypothetical protein A3K64_04080 [Candidatus Micrarchaeota archaeon RBG_16_36_9]|nr:MAG: hypothetical protein A3K64_04080 [Candidatus Micrarchaeota archaeon RBG_16_36_9]